MDRALTRTGIVEQTQQQSSGALPPPLVAVCPVRVMATGRIPGARQDWTDGAGAGVSGARFAVSASLRLPERRRMRRRESSPEWLATSRPHGW